MKTYRTGIAFPLDNAERLQVNSFLLETSVLKFESIENRSKCLN